MTLAPFAPPVPEATPLCVVLPSMPPGDGSDRPPRRSRGPCQTKNKSPLTCTEGFEAPFGVTPEEAEYAAAAPRSVWACLRGEWSMLVAAKDGSSRTVYPFRCRSWRCPRCRHGVARSDFARILGALTSPENGKRDWLLLTLTFDPRAKGPDGATLYKDKWDAYRGAKRAWQLLNQRLARRYGSRSAPAKVRYVAVWERHKSGWPHAHLAIDCPELTFDLRARGLCQHDRHGFGPWRTVERRDGSGSVKAENWAWKVEVLDELGQACGFGIVSDVQFPRKDEGGVAGYFAKLSSELVGMFDQRPVDAPKGFRRLRGSRKTLPPRFRGDGSNTGGLYQKTQAHVERFLAAWESGGCSALRILEVETNLWLSIRLRRARSVAKCSSVEGGPATSSAARSPPPSRARPTRPLPGLLPFPK